MYTFALRSVVSKYTVNRRFLTWCKICSISRKSAISLFKTGPTCICRTAKSKHKFQIQFDCAGNKGRFKRSCWNADHADCRLCRPCRLCRLCRLSVIFLLVPQFSSKIFTIVSCFPSLCALCITIICCTDVYLQGSWVGNEKITAHVYRQM